MHLLELLEITVTILFTDECPRFCQVPSQDTAISAIPWSSTFSLNWSAAAIIDSVATLCALAIFFWVSLNAPTYIEDKSFKNPQNFSNDEYHRPISLIAITDRILMSKGAFPFSSFSAFLLVYISLDHMWQFLYLNFKQQLHPFFFEWSISKHKWSKYKFLLSHSGHVPIRLIMSDNMSKSIIMFENVEEFSLISFFGAISFFIDVDTCLFLGCDSVLLSAVCRFPMNLLFLKYQELPVDLRLPASNFCFLSLFICCICFSTSLKI